MNELLEIAILAYRNGRYNEASDLLFQIIDVDAKNWLARLYLGMTHHKSGRIPDAQRVFKRLTVECPQDDIRAKAENALPLVEAEMRRRFEKQPVATKSSASSDYDELEVIGNPFVA